MKNLQKADGFENQYLFVLQQDFLAQFQKNPLFSPFMVTDIGYFPTAQYHYRERDEGCEEGIMLYCAKGAGHYRLNGGEEVTVGPQKAFVLPPHIAHTYAACEQTPWSVYWLHFSGRNMQPLCDLMQQQNQPLTLAPSQSDEVEQLFHRCFKLLKQPCRQEEYFAVCQYALTAVSAVILAGKQAKSPLTQKGGQAVEDALRFMKNNLHQTLTLSQTAAATGFSASHLHAIFKATTGHSPMNYFLHMKMQAAAKEFYFSNLSVKEIAAQYGIYDSCYFSRIFKKVMGMSPLAYRGLKIG